MDETYQNATNSHLATTEIKLWVPPSYTTNKAPANQKHLDILKQGVDVWNKWRKENPDIEEPILYGVDLSRADLRGANLMGADLMRANLSQADFRGANLYAADLSLANFTSAIFDEATDLRGVCLSDATLVDIRWGGVNLTNIDWRLVKRLGNESQLRDVNVDLKKQTKFLHILTLEVLQERVYRNVALAYHQLAVALREQGLNEEADRFAYRSMVIQRVGLRLEGRWLKYLSSWFFCLLAGYGYRPGRSVIWYLAMIFGFALAYFAIGNLPFFPDAFVFSLTSFHGRGFFPGLGSENSLHNPLVIMAAFEAVIGLLIEISFIATFTQRFFVR